MAEGLEFMRFNIDPASDISFIPLLWVDGGRAIFWGDAACSVCCRGHHENYDPDSDASAQKHQYHKNVHQADPAVELAVPFSKYVFILITQLVCQRQKIEHHSVTDKPYPCLTRQSFSNCLLVPENSSAANHRSKTKKKNKSINIYFLFSEYIY